MFTWQKHVVPPMDAARNQKEKDLIANDESFPNYRLSTLSCISHFKDEAEEKKLNEKRKEVFARLYNADYELFNVSL